METEYNLYFCGQQINSRGLSEKDVEELKKHDTVNLVRGRHMQSIPMKHVRIVKRILM